MEHLSYARAKLVILGELSDHRKLSGTHGRELFSPGLWGIESDSGDWYFEQVYQEERDILLCHPRQPEDLRNSRITSARALPQLRTHRRIIAKLHKARARRRGPFFMRQRPCPTAPRGRGRPGSG